MTPTESAVPAIVPLVRHWVPLMLATRCKMLTPSDPLATKTVFLVYTLYRFKPTSDQNVAPRLWRSLAGENVLQMSSQPVSSIRGDFKLNGQICRVYSYGSFISTFTCGHNKQRFCLYRVPFHKTLGDVRVYDNSWLLYRIHYLQKRCTLYIGFDHSFVKTTPHIFDKSATYCSAVQSVYSESEGGWLAIKIHSHKEKRMQWVWSQHLRHFDQLFIVIYIPRPRLSKGPKSKGQIIERQRDPWKFIF